MAPKEATTACTKQPANQQVHPLPPPIILLVKPALHRKVLFAWGAV
jgi:hypothetical protein